MKAKTLLGMIACASACAVSVNVLAEDLSWFDGKVNTTTSALPTPQNATWTAPTGDGAITYSTGKITLDNSSDNLLVLAPVASSEPTLSDGVVTIAATAVLTPTDASALEAITDAKAGFAAGIWTETVNDVTTTYTNYYGYAAGEGTGEWVKLAAQNVTVPDPESASPNTTFKIVLDYRTGAKTAEFRVGDVLLADASDSTRTSFSIGSDATSLANVAAYGSGSISALATTCEKAVCAATVNGAYKKFGSAVEALAAADSGTELKDITADGTPTSQQQAANGIFAWQCDVLNVDENAQITLTPAGSDGDNIKLAVNVTPDEGASVKFNVVPAAGGDAVVTGCSPTAITIPATASGKYKIVPVITKASN